jgi:hypothetical protein
MIRLFFIISMLCLFLSPAMWSADPAPAMPAAMAADWQANATAAASASASQAKSTAATAPAQESIWKQLVGWGVGAMGVLVVLGKALNTANPLTATLVAVLGAGYDLLVPRYVRDAEAKRDLLAEGLGKVAHVIETLPNDGTVGQLKGKFLSKLPSAISDHLTEVSTALKARGVGPEFALSVGTIAQAPAASVAPAVCA